MSSTIDKARFGLREQLFRRRRDRAQRKTRQLPNSQRTNITSPLLQVTL
jgi:hypothetical protein